MYEGYIINEFSNEYYYILADRNKKLLVILSKGDYLGLPYLNSLDHLNDILYNHYLKIISLENIHKVARYISFSSANGQAWTGYPLQLNKDSAGELYGVYKNHNSIYGGYVDTHRDIYKPVPRIVSLQMKTFKTVKTKSKDNNNIKVLFSYDDNYVTYKIEYKGYIAYADVPNLNRLKKNIRKHILKLANLHVVSN